MVKKNLRKFFFPQSNLGKLSILFILIFVLLLLFSRGIVLIQGSRDNQTFFDNPLFSIFMLLSMISGISSFFVGILGIIRKKEKCVFVYFSSLIGFLLLLFLIGEFSFPH